MLRIAYVWFDREEGGEVAVVMLIGDKTELGNDWYPPTVKQIEGTMIGEWHRRHPNPQAPITEQSPSNHRAITEHRSEGSR